jgi:hypothetical protein
VSVDRLSLALVSLGFLVLLVGVYFYVSPYLITRIESDSKDVPQRGLITVTLNLEQGDRIEGNFTVDNHYQGDNAIGFRIRDPDDSLIFKTVTGRWHFAFTAEKCGEYTIYLDDGQSSPFSTPSTKTVSWSYQATVKAFPGYVSLVVALIGLLMLVYGLSRVALRRRICEEPVILDTIGSPKVSDCPTTD